MSYFTDIKLFNLKFGLPVAGDGVRPRTMDEHTAAYRIAFMLEELGEFCEAHGFRSTVFRLSEAREAIKYDCMRAEDHDLEKAGDALLDLTYVALGTGHFMGLPLDPMWDEVQRANMDKERAKGADDPRSSRGNAHDCIKPVGWLGPQHGPILQEAFRKASIG